MGMKRLLLCLLLGCVVNLSRADIVINEICPSNTRDIDRGWNYGGWIELYNEDSSSQDLYGYFLSDDASNLRKFRIIKHITIPANGYVVFYGGGTATDTLQMKFDLDCDGGRIYLSDRIGRELSHVDYPVAMPNISYARTTDAGDEWSYCAFPTNTASNNGAPFATERCPEPEFSHPGGIFLTGSDRVDLSIDCPEGMRVLYTTDTKQPTLDSDEWSGSKRLSTTLIVRAMTVGDGYLPSRIVTRSYIFSDHQPSLPVVSVVTDKANLWDSMYGIYTTGSNGLPGNGSDSPRNWNRDWSRPANIEYFVEGEAVVSQPCDIAISGGWSRGSAMKSLKVTAKKKYDLMNSFDYSFFPSKLGLKYKAILLRNGGNDWSNSMMKDALLQMTVAEVLDIEYQSYQPTVHFLNGQYYGIINLRERNNTQYVYSNFGWDEEEIDMIERVPNSVAPGIGYEVKAGDTEAIDYVLELAAKLPDEAAYAELTELVDINSLVNYLMPELWTGNWDWPQNNLKFFRHRDGGKFRWVLYDLENGFGDLSFNHFTNGDYGFDGSKAAGGHTTPLMQGLLRQPQFQTLLIDNMSICLGSVFLPERFDHIADSIYALIADELPYNRERWNTTWSAANHVEDFKNFNRQRPSYIRDHFRNKFALGADIPLSISSTHPAATLTLNTLPLPLGYMDGYSYQGHELTLTATAPAGYRFVGWSAEVGAEQTVMAHGASWKYYDQGSLDGTSWMSTDYNDRNWTSGNAPLGYAKEGLATDVSYGNNADNKNPTTYFRTSFTLSSHDPQGTYNVNLYIDDGAIIYINGVEACRYLMPSGNVSFNTYASSHANGNPDHVNLNIPAHLLRQGKNTIAIEVHQNSATSSDQYMDLAVTTILPQQGSLVTHNPYVFTINTPTSLEALFEPEAQPSASVPPVRINEVCLSNATYINEYFKRNDWIELYNTTNEPQSIAGLYITNNINNPQYYCIPDEGELSVIPPYGYRILWADKMMAFTELHLPFKLSAEGECLMLSSYDNKGALQWTDSMYIGDIGKNVSYGRYPNGADELYVMNRMTFADANYYSPYNKPIRFTPDEASIQATQADGAYPHITYDATAAMLRVTLPAHVALPTTLSLYDMQGRCIATHLIDSTTSHVSTASLKQGVYVVRIAGVSLKIYV